MKRFLMLALCNVVDNIDNLPWLSRYRNVALTLYAVVVTIFALEVGQIGMGLQLPLALLAVLLGIMPFLFNWGSRKIGRYMAKRVFGLIKKSTQQRLSLSRRASSEDEVLEWLREHYPFSASRLVARELIIMTVNSAQKPGD